MQIPIKHSQIRTLACAAFGVALLAPAAAYAQDGQGDAHADLHGRHDRHRDLDRGLTLSTQTP